MKKSYKATLAATAVALASVAAVSSATAAPISAPASHPVRAAIGTPTNISGVWNYYQSNSNSAGTMHVTEDPNGNLFGYAIGQDALGNTIQGNLETGSQVDGDFVIFTIDWPGGATGQYTGALESDGTLYGHTVNLNHTVAQATWWTYATF